MKADAAAKKKAEEERRRKEEEDEVRARQWAEEREREMQQENAKQEQLMRQEEEDRARIAAAEQERLQEERMQQEREEAEAARVDAEVKKKAALAEAKRQQAVKEWMMKNKFATPNQVKTSCMSASSPLTVAAKQNNAEIASMLLAEGAKPEVKVGGKTALERAKLANKNGSHKAVIKALGGA